MSKDQSRVLTEINSRMKTAELKRKDGRSIKFRMYLTKSMRETPLDVLDLAPRSHNCLRRAGYETIGDILDALSSGYDLKRIKNCGKTSVRDIMEHLLMYQYNSLPKDRQDEYLDEVVKMNIG